MVSLPLERVYRLKSKREQKAAIGYFRFAYFCVRCSQSQPASAKLQNVFEEFAFGCRKV